MPSKCVSAFTLGGGRVLLRGYCAVNGQESEPRHRRAPPRVSRHYTKGPSFKIRITNHSDQTSEVVEGSTLPHQRSQPATPTWSRPRWTGSGARSSKGCIATRPFLGVAFPRCRPSNRSCKFCPRGASSSSASSSYRLTARTEPGTHIGRRLPAERWACSRPSLGRAAGPAPRVRVETTRLWLV